MNREESDMADAEPLISIAIPSHNGLEKLERTLDSIAATETDLSRIEVVVADDGSTDGTYETFADRSYPFAFRMLKGDWQNQSMASNEAISRCTGRYILMAAQDIVFRSDLISEHLRLHEKLAGEEVAVLGYLPYPDDLDVSPFMFYLINGGNQFAYYLIKDPMRVPPNYVYAPNLSVRRSTLERVGLFDEKLPYGYQDTDLGIRLVDAGVRIAYNRDAVGYHNHRVDLGSYSRRQEKVAGGAIRVSEKHPHHEGELPCWDVVVESHLIYSTMRYELDLEEIARLEAELAERPEYQDLWDRVWNQAEDVGSFPPEDRNTIAIVDRLFNFYTRVTHHHWAQGYLKEGLQRYGAQHVEAALHARLSKLQASIPTYRLVDRRLDEHGLTSWKFGGVSRSTRIVYDIENYAEAVGCIEPYLAPGMPIFNQQLVLVIREDALTAEEFGRVGEIADVVRCTNLDKGIAEALIRAEAEVVTVASAKVNAEEHRAAALAEKIFDRMPAVAVLGGSIRGADETRSHFGFRIDEESVGRPLHGATTRPQPIPVDAAIAEFFAVRRSAAVEALGRISPGDAWNIELCREITAAGGMCLHVPEYAATYRAGVEVAPAMCGVES